MAVKHTILYENADVSKAHLETIRLHCDTKDGQLSDTFNNESKTCISTRLEKNKLVKACTKLK